MADMIQRIPGRYWLRITTLDAKVEMHRTLIDSSSLRTTKSALQPGKKPLRSRRS